MKYIYRKIGARSRGPNIFFYFSWQSWGSNYTGIRSKFIVCSAGVVSTALGEEPLLVVGLGSLPNRAGLIGSRYGS